MAGHGRDTARVTVTRARTWTSGGAHGHVGAQHTPRMLDESGIDLRPLDSISPPPLSLFKPVSHQNEISGGITSSSIVW